MRDIEYFTHQKLTLAQLPTAEETPGAPRGGIDPPAQCLDSTRPLPPGARHCGESCRSRGDLLEIATAALKLARAEEKQRPIATVRAVADEAPHRSERRDRGLSSSGKNVVPVGGPSRMTALPTSRAWCACP